MMQLVSLTAFLSQSIFFSFMESTVLKPFLGTALTLQFSPELWRWVVALDWNHLNYSILLLESCETLKKFG